MKFMQAVVHCFRHYATFRGRASRSEFWHFMLFNCLVSFIVECSAVFSTVYFILAIATLGICLPAIAVMVRRFHDRNRSGWWVLLLYIMIFLYALYPQNLFLLLVTLVTLITAIYGCVKKGTPGSNDYGEDPLMNER